MPLLAGDKCPPRTDRVQTLAPSALAVLVLAPVSVVVKDRYGLDWVKQLFWNYTTIWIENDLNYVLFPGHFS